MNYKKLLTLPLAAVFACLTFSACANDDIKDPEISAPVVDVVPPSAEPEPFPPVSEEPEVPEVPGEPEVPETPEEPNEPEEPEAPEVPNEPEEPEQPTVPEEPRAEYVQALVGGLNVRSGAGTQFTSLGRLDKGTLVELRGEQNGWYETSYRGKKAFVSAAYAVPFTLEQGSEKVENVIREGLKRLGVQYVYGAVRYHDGTGKPLSGFTTDAFDCSSLMQYIFYMGAGVNLSLTTRTQVLQGKAVSKENLQRGDLMFFTNTSRYYNTGVERIGHVALYLGDNYILHTASDFAKIEQISDLRWSYYITARRMI